jgi:hypothetical protein
MGKSENFEGKSDGFDAFSRGKWSDFVGENIAKITESF